MSIFELECQDRNVNVCNITPGAPTSTLCYIMKDKDFCMHFNNIWGDSWYMAFSIFQHVNPRSRSWMKSKTKFTQWVQHPIDSRPFHSMSTSLLIPKICLLQTLSLKIQGQGHKQSQSSLVQGTHWSNILSIHILFIPCQTALPFLRHSYFKIWLWKSMVKVMGEAHISFALCQPAIPFLRNGYFNIWPWIYQVKVMGEFRWAQNHIDSQSYIPFVPC